ncbi:MAG TPA: hypothetical protein HPQ04_05025 [Rhodospirillaceae bacterium]|nr:hypothetical protein [Rhodospirillaceae bacterium]
MQAARDVAFSLDQTLKSARHAAASPSALSGKALETTERLFNLLDLLSSWLEVVGPGLHDDLATGIAVLRDKALPVGVRLIGQRARRILRRGEHAASGADGFPVGISLALAESVAGLRTSVDSLGGMENIPDELRTTIDRTYKVIETLIELENRHGVFREFEIGPARDIFD